MYYDPLSTIMVYKKDKSSLFACTYGTGKNLQKRQDTSRKESFDIKLIQDSNEEELL